ncbi:methyltransferase domain-containing protein [Gongronella butleri]|nr:methyltransferase domain-containing protein [Gongronella butleri]
MSVSTEMISKEKVQLAKSWLKRTYMQAALAIVVFLTMASLIKSRKQAIGVYIDRPYTHGFTAEPFSLGAIRFFNEHLRLFTTNCMCNKFLVGSINRNGYSVGCLDSYTQSNCLVYSFGSDGQFEYENDTYDKFGCEVHTVNADRFPSPDYIQFHQAKVGACANCRSVASILEGNGHLNTTISALKVDVAGGEWDILDDIFADNVNQVQLVIHKPNFERMSHLDRFGDRFCLVDTNIYIMGHEMLNLVFVNKKLMKPMRA